MEEKNAASLCECHCEGERWHGSVSHIEDENMLLRLSDLFKLISDITRIKILLALDGCAMCVCDICAVLGMTKSAISHQLKSLRDGNLIKSKKIGRHVFYELADSHVKDIIEKTIEHVSEK